MANLLIEYCKRHNTEFVLPTNNGMCFFNHNDTPAFICLTSMRLHQQVCLLSPTEVPIEGIHSQKLICKKCSTKESLIIIELFGRRLANRFEFLLHDHIHPDTDIIKYIKDSGHENLKPVYLKTGRDIELWL